MKNNDHDNCYNSQKIERIISLLFYLIYLHNNPIISNSLFLGGIFLEVRS